MPIGMVVTVSDQWYRNVLIGISKGVIEIDYWTNGWLPDVKKNANRLEVYYQGALILEGDIVDEYKETPANVFYKYQNNLYAIGLQPQDNINNFQQMLDSAFRKACEPEIGNIIFQVDGISSTIINGLRSKGINIPNGIKALPQQNANQTINKITYK
jgi:hypothetical protein